MNEQEKYDWMVYVSCLTYNHAPYVEDAMNGFTMQKTDFPFVCCIVDDASTDGEQEVIKKYLNEHFDLADKKVVRQEETDDYVLTFARHKTNSNCFFAVFYLKYNHYSIKKPKAPYLAQWRDKAKYIALCEGDDYWIHPLKLQKQVDFMEDHPDCSLCFHNAVVTYDNFDKASYLFNDFGVNREFHLSELLDKWICPTPSLLIRNPLFPLFPIKGSIISGDWRMILHCAAKGKVWGMKAVMSCYRKSDLPSSMSNTYSHRADEVFLKKVPILEGFDEYTDGKYHELVSEYIRYYSKMGQLVAFKKKHGMLLTCILNPVTLMEMVWKRRIRPRIDKKAPTYSA